MKKKLALLALISVFGISKAEGEWKELGPYAFGLLGLGATKYVIEAAGKTQLVKKSY